MNEYLAFGYLTDLAAIIKTISWNARAVMWLETALDHFLSDDEREHGVRFEAYRPETPFEQFSRGRIFDEAAEFKWEKEGQQFHVVYCGQQPSPVSLTVEASAAFTFQNSSYYLWGSRIKNEDRVDLGLKIDEVVFAELRIPRILRYPVSLKAERVKLRVREFHDDEGALVYTRFLGLEEET